MNKISLPDDWDVLVIRWYEKQQRQLNSDFKIATFLLNHNKPK